MDISYLKHNEIDFKKWDNCIDNSFNGIVYAYSWYLDTVCEEWEALVSEDYKYVMPITGRKKFGISYLYQPVVSQQLGVFAIKKLDFEIVDTFLAAIPVKFRLIEISLNSFNKSDNKDFSQIINSTYQLDLIKSYKILYKAYSTNTKRNIKKAISNKLNIIGSPSINDVIDLLKKDNSQINKGFKDEDFIILRKLISSAIRYKSGMLVGAYDEFNNLCAAAFFITSHNKSIFLLAVSDDNGKKERAMFLIVDDFIKRNSEKNLTIDFEGSNIPGVARFYSGFGASACKYISLRRNKLPFPLKMLKSIKR